MSGIKIYIVSYEVALRMEDTFSKMRPQCVIVDEAHYLKNL